jgi:hypothetical protein
MQEFQGALRLFAQLATFQAQRAVNIRKYCSAGKITHNIS